MSASHELREIFLNHVKLPHVPIESIMTVLHNEGMNELSGANPNKSNAIVIGSYPSLPADKPPTGLGCIQTGHCWMSSSSTRHARRWARGCALR
jgi:hypothetical protein